MYTLTKINLMWEKLKELTAQVAGIASHVLPGTGSATTGQILKLTADKTPAWADEYSYTPPAYSTDEVNTGQKWIDGRDIYCKSYSGTLPEITSTQNIVIDNIENIELINFINTLSDGIRTYTNRYPLVYNISVGNVGIYNVSTTFSEEAYTATIFYVKTPPVPANLADNTREETEEPIEELKTIKKKTTKKEETK